MVFYSSKGTKLTRIPPKDYTSNPHVLKSVLKFTVLVVMTTISSCYRVFRILYVVFLHTLRGSHISLPTLLICIGSLSVTVSTSSGVCLSLSVFKLVYPLIFNLA